MQCMLVMGTNPGNPDRMGKRPTKSGSEWQHNQSPRSPRTRLSLAKSKYAVESHFTLSSEENRTYRFSYESVPLLSILIVASKVGV